MNGTKLVSLFALLASCGLLSTAIPTYGGNVTAFPYQGSLAQATNLLDGTYDVRYVLFTNLANGNQVGSPITNFGVAIKGSRFDTTLDFGPGSFYGKNMWLEIAVRSNNNVGFSTLPLRLPVSLNPMMKSISRIHVWGATILLFALIVTPAVEFLCVGWRKRRNDIVEGFSNTAIKAYFSAFHPQEKIEDIAEFRKRFEWYYSSQFGRLRFIVPLTILMLLVGLLFCWSTLTVVDLLSTGTVAPGELPMLAVVAVMGAYMWVSFDAISRWRTSDLAPADFYWWCFRLTIAVPMGYAVQEAFSEKLSIPIVFFFGAFPTSQILTIARRIATQKMGFADSENRDVSELQSLQGIDTPKAESFSSENITTILQLAYCDPIRLTIRTGLAYSYIVDCTCQALLWIYVGKDIASLGKSGLRSAYEVVDLCLDLRDPDAKARAESIIHEVAVALGRSDASISNIFTEVAEDPYTQFLYLSWSGANEADFNSEQKEFLSL